MDLPSPGKMSKSKGLNVPFYAVPGNVKTSSEIISEARASVRSVDTKRPFTPREDKRRLFENASRCTRPPSACTLDNLKYELPESSSNMPAAPQFRRENKKKSTDLSPKDCLRQSNVPMLSSDEILIGRKINSAPGRIQLPSISTNKTHFQLNLDELPEEISPRDCEMVKQPSLKDTSLGIKDNVKMKFDSSLKSMNSLEKNKYLCISPSPHEPDHIIEDSAESYFNSLILPLLDELIYAKKSGELESKMCVIMKQLYKSLEDGQFFENIARHRALILKTIFKLFDSKNCSLLLQAARICLAMNVTGNNLTSISKVLFKVTRKDNNDMLFLEDNILELFLHSINSMNPLRDTDALIYSIGSLKFLAMNTSLLREISRYNGVEIICRHMKKINDHKMSIASEDICDQISHVLFQLTGCLRNLAENTANRKMFVSTGAIDELCRVLAYFAEDLDIIMNVARILSKLTMYYEVCNKIADNTMCFPSLLYLLDMYKSKQDLVVRLCFAFGNIAAKNENARLQLLQQSNSLNILIELILMNFDNKKSAFVDRQRDLLAFTATTVASNTTDADADISNDIVVKVIRMLANMSISYEVGQEIAHSEKCIDFLMAVLGTRDVKRHEELIFSSLATLSNLSYYSMDNHIFNAKLQQLVEHLSRFLEVNNTDILIESLRVLGNISRTEAAKEQLASKKVIETAVSFLEYENKDVVYLSCGLLMNFMTVTSNRIIMKRENGIEKIINILKEFGSQDWQLASIICQTLWNYTCEPITNVNNMEPTSCSELNGLLTKYLDEKQAFGTSHVKLNESGRESAHDLWQLEFCPVAQRLLSKIQHQHVLL